MRTNDEILLQEAYQLVLESSKENFAKDGIIFLKRNEKDLGCCIGVNHGKKISLSLDLIERIKRIPNLKFYAEGIAAKDYNSEPYMVPFMEKNFPDKKIQKKSWDDITEEEGKGTANPENNIYWMFANHKANKLLKTRYMNYVKGTILDALVNANIFPKNAPTDKEERRKWIYNHLSKAGFSKQLNRKFEPKEFIKFMDDVEYSVYPNQQFPDTKTYLGKQVLKVELERNRTIYNLMTEGSCCFAGSGHLIELKQQFPNLELIE